jgi:alpha-amylase/alpha-mannosidase (GH57 family)
MHQPFYKDLWTGEYKLPWTRLHAMKDYAGMVEILGEFPRIHQTFNLVPSMVAQIEEYAEGKASDPFLDCALEPAEGLTEAQRNFIVKYFFQVHVERIMYRYPRYRELYEKREQRFSVQDLRDLQIYSQIAWFDEDLLAREEELRALIAKGRDFSREDQAMMARNESAALKRVLPVYREYAAKGQIEISRLRSIIRFCRCCAIRILRGCRIRACICRRGFNTRKMRGCNWRGRARISKRSSG